MNEAIAEYALGEAVKGAEWAEVRCEHYTENFLLWKNGILDNVAFMEQNGLSLRVLVDGAMGFSSTNILQKQTIREMAQRAIKMASLHKRKSPIVLSEEKTIDTKWEVKQKVPFPGVEDKILSLQHIDECLMDTKTVLARFYYLEDTSVDRLYINSEGARICSFVPRLSLYYLITIGHNGDTQQMTRQFGNTGGWEHFRGWKVEENIVHDAEILTRILKEGKQAPAGVMDCILGPTITGLVAHESCGHPFEADRIFGRESAQAGKSFVTDDMVGSRLGSDSVTIIDDPTLPGSYGFYAYDDEGIKAQRRYLLKNGVIASFLHNRETSYCMGETSNASSRSSSFNVEPIIRMANTYIAPGEYSLEELCEDISEGIYMVSFMEWNIDDTRYNQKYVGSEAYRIQDGEIASLVRQPTLEITTPALYRSVDAVGKKLEFTAATCGKGDPMQGIPVWTGGPAIRLRNVRIG